MKSNDFRGVEDFCLYSFYMTSHGHEHCMTRKEKKERDKRNPVLAQGYGQRFEVNVWDVI